MTSPRGFTLFVAIVFASVTAMIGVTIAVIVSKQVQLASSAKLSQVAFYNADGALECALYWDQGDRNAFDYTTPLSTISCQGKSLPVTTTPPQGVGPRTLSFTLPCGTIVTIYKQPSGNASFYAEGSSCNASGNPVSRGIKAQY